MDSQNQTKREKTGGRPAKITPELLDRLAERRAGGMPLRFALARENPPFPLRHFEESLAKSPPLSGLWLAKQAERIEPLLAAIRGATMRTLPGAVWLLERGYPADFGPPKARDTGQVQVNVNVGRVAPAESYARATRLIMGRGVSQGVGRIGPPQALGRGA
jgi:hypothetical protein